ncbi:MAG: hypothetical protein JWN04_4471 [Myxococcaceae bacterium]|nr:hypothetical protein [Myxococcaceae bacterium]
MSSASDHLPTVCAQVAVEVLTNVVEARCRCPKCSADIVKSVYADGDSELCTACGESLWFELRDGRAIAHVAHQRSSGVSLSELLSKRL